MGNIQLSWLMMVFLGFYCLWTMGKDLEILGTF